ncbi:MAG TPA: CBS domain-containing protein [Spirochaetia bacterium]|nr:CBS domain-containing protein [Spirochaetia bacterium]
METVKDILKMKGGEIFSVSPETTVYEALKVMSEKNIGSVLVLNQRKQVSGIFSERDIVRGMAKKDIDIKTTPVKSLMTKKVLNVGENYTVEECMALMTEKRIRHLPVVENGKLSGIISIGDVVKAVIFDQRFVIDQLERYISGSM